MSKLPYMQFYPLDWLRDTRRLMPITRAAWIDILSVAWNEPERGIYVRHKDSMMRELGIEQEDIDIVLDDLLQVADVSVDKNDFVHIMSRRMIRDEKEREKERFRKRRQRCPADVPPMSLDCPQEKLEVRSYKKKYIKKKFEKPTAQELTAYGASIGYSLDAQKFLAHYEANGWKVGKNPMASWKGAVQIWKCNGFESGAVSVKAAVLPKYVENVPAPEDVMTGEDILGLKTQLGMKV